MRVALISFGLALVLAGMAVAQAPTPALPSGVLLMTKDSQGNAVTRFIPVNYLNLEALCAALGGTCIDLNSLYSIGRSQSQGPTRNPGSGLNRGAPLSPFVPTGVRDIVGLRR